MHISTGRKRRDCSPMHTVMTTHKGWFPNREVSLCASASLSSAPQHAQNSAACAIFLHCIHYMLIPYAEYVYAACAIFPHCIHYMFMLHAEYAYAAETAGMFSESGLLAVVWQVVSARTARGIRTHFSCHTTAHHLPNDSQDTVLGQHLCLLTENDSRL